MSTPKSPAPKGDGTLVEHQDGSITLSKERAVLCNESAWELEAMAKLLPDLCPSTEEYGETLVLRTMASRMLQLSSVLMGAIGDNLETVQRLHKKVHLTAMESEA